MSLSLADRQAILALLHQEVVPALGCTEPIAVALTAARAAEALGRKPERLDVAVSANLLKNGMGVMVPGTGEKASVRPMRSSERSEGVPLGTLGACLGIVEPS